MARYRKKPVVIEAVRVGDALASLDHRPQWLIDAVRGGTVMLMCDKTQIKTKAGVMRAENGDWIICGVKGELYPCKPDIFDLTYEPLDPGCSA